MINYPILFNWYPSIIINKVEELDIIKVVFQFENEFGKMDLREKRGESWDYLN